MNLDEKNLHTASTGGTEQNWATVAIIVCTLLWGAGFPALKSVEALPALFVISVRFTLASVGLSLIFFRRFKRLNKTLIKNAFVLSFLVFIMYVFATVGIKYTTSAKASFFSCLGFVIIPFLNLLFYRRKIGKTTMISVILCFAGITLLSYTSDMGFNLALGDIICIGGSIAGSFQIVFLDRMTKNPKNDPTLLSIWMMIFIACFSIVGLLFTDFRQISVDRENVYLLIFIGIFCTAIPYVLQAVGQKYVSSTKVGLICALEPTSGAVFSVILLGERMGIHGWIGGAVVIASLVYMELMGHLERKKQDNELSQQDDC
jgi:drug/metabolite transporter (DMT)-like permease